MHNPAEIVQHATEESHPQNSQQRWLGLTTAFLSILIAVCSSQSNSVRTELMARMVEEDGANVSFQTVSTKYLMLQAQLQHLHAMMPDPPQFLEAEAELKKLEAGKMNEETAQVVRALRLHNRKVLNAAMPSPAEMLQFAERIRIYRTELEAAQKWSESYRPMIRELGQANSRMEYAQLLSELAVVLASLALMLSSFKKLSRSFWLISIVLGIFGIIILVVALVLNQGAVHSGEEQMRQAREAFLTLVRGYDNTQRDETLLKGIEADLEKLRGQQ